MYVYKLTHSFHYVGDIVIAFVIHGEKLIDSIGTVLQWELGVVEIAQLQDHAENLVHGQIGDVCRVSEC